LVKIIGLRRILFHNKSGLRHIFFHFVFKKILKKTGNRDAFDLKFLVLSTNSLVVKIISTLILNNHDDVTCTKQ